jgi:GDP-L-fucose synthase
VLIWGDGKARREFLFAEDLAGFIVRALPRLESLPLLLNVGVGDDASITEYYEACARVVGYEGAFTYDPTKPKGMQRKLLDCTQVHAWGWRAETPLLAGLRATYAHYVESLASAR